MSARAARILVGASLVAAVLAAAMLCLSVVEATRFARATESWRRAPQEAATGVAASATTGAAAAAVAGVPAAPSGDHDRRHAASHAPDRVCDRPAVPRAPWRA